MKFALIDDHQMVREGFKALIEEEDPDWQVSFEASSYSECLQNLGDIDIDCFVIDISLPDRNGLEVSQLIGNKLPSAKRIILSMYEEKSYIQRALDLGVDAYLSKRDAAEELITAIHSIFKNQLFLSPSINTHFLKPQKTDSVLNKLTPRELEVFKLLAQGFNAKQVSQVIDIMPKTAHVHRASIMSKLNLTSQIQITKLALEKGVILIDDIG
ncbi:response regulator transcription factor [Pseudoalteromonas sp. B5MOD-1]|uniref:response regulator transcription factor n=1 Tax=Pseudoalteromonas TaxID=53246 RepID=UPI0007853283|nr:MULTISPECIES: response regulator transcription factor [Pseudoalteromonas]MCO7209000.1 response regulator transcription factor [Pseudoalteromonas sp. CnMc7-37]RZF88644.1 response regulator transcription factor [Pseudoalteromonas sp. CO109Y]TMO37948.1 DNA-binding response regulator [Pseudoalteromonas sp. S4491]TMO40924.1 DNA-binding response regulator [Pseudoalteromonas sp. S4488]URQ85870.1 response regulator transcription factor [Pseudoalteromonas sp. SCSIO 43088]